MKKFINIYTISIIVLLLVIGLSIGYSAFNSKLIIGNTIADVRLKTDIRITGINVDSVTNGGISTYEEYNVSSISNNISLPNNESEVTYKIKVTNFGNVEMGIRNITIDSELLDYELTSYTLKDKICDASLNCSLGIEKEFYITLKYKEGIVVDNENYTFDVNLKFDFQPFYKVTYDGISGDSYPKEVIGNDTLNITFQDKISNIEITIDDVVLDSSKYTFDGTNLVIPNISGDVKIASVGPPTAAKTLLAKSNDSSITTYTKGNTHEMYTFQHDATEQTEALTDYRYIGKDPYNYVTFNNELWRIIGVFTVEDGNGNKEQRIKIMRNSRLLYETWHEKQSSGVYNNVWNNSGIENLLNDAYYSQGTYKYNSIVGSSITYNFSSSGLDYISRLMIKPTKFYVGGSKNLISGEDNASAFYSHEKGPVYSGLRYWIGNIGLMYPSDYLYTFAMGVNDNCYKNKHDCNPNGNWLPIDRTDSWFITPYYGNTKVQYLYYGQDVRERDTDSEAAAYPVVYLKPDVQIDGGIGTNTDPYTLSLIPSASGTYSIQYLDWQGAEVTFDGLPNQVTANSTLNVTFPDYTYILSITMAGVEVPTNAYTFDGINLTIPNVIGDIRIGIL